MLARIAHTTPHEGHWQEAWQAVQVQARALIAQLADEYTLHS